MRWLVGLLAALAVGWEAWNLVFSDHGVLVWRKEKAEVRELEQEVARLRAERERLAREILRLRDDPDALEELVHRELGYVYPDEIMVVFPRGQASGGKAADGARR